MREIKWISLEFWGAESSRNESRVVSLNGPGPWWHIRNHSAKNWLSTQYIAKRLVRRTPPALLYPKSVHLHFREKGDASKCPRIRERERERKFAGSWLAFLEWNKKTDLGAFLILIMNNWKHACKILPRKTNLIKGYTLLFSLFLFTPRT